MKEIWGPDNTTEFLPQNTNCEALHPGLHNSGVVCHHNCPRNEFFTASGYHWPHFISMIDSNWGHMLMSHPKETGACQTPKDETRCLLGREHTTEMCSLLIQAVRFMVLPRCLCIGRKNITLSTSGLVASKIVLAVSDSRPVYTNLR